MSLSDITKCDLSAGIAKVDYSILLNSLKNYMAIQINRLSDKCREYYPFAFVKESNHKSVNNCVYHGRDMNFLVEEIRKTAELIYTLENANPFDITEDKRDIQWV